MKLRLVLFLLFFSQNAANARVILDKKIFYAELNGQVDLKFGYALNQSAFRDKPKDKTSNYSNLSLLYLQSVSANTQIGLGIKAGISDIINKLSTFNVEKLDIEERYFVIKNKALGSINYGKKNLVSQSMLINTSKIYAAAGGVNGNWANYANLRGEVKKFDGPGYENDKVFWVKPNIYSNHNGLNSANVTPVISYISPAIYNFQFGLSYVPGKNNLEYSNLIGAGLSYQNSLSEDISFTAALTGELARQNFTDAQKCIEDHKCNNPLKHWNFGVNVKFFNFNGIFSYGDGGNSGWVGTTETKNTYYMNAGVAYHSGSSKLSLTYFTSKKEISNSGLNELSSYALSLERPLFIGTSYYFDVVKFETQEPKIQNNNSGYVFLAGLKLNL